MSKTIRRHQQKHKLKKFRLNKSRKYGGYLHNSNTIISSSSSKKNKNTKRKSIYNNSKTLNNYKYINTDNNKDNNILPSLIKKYKQK